MRAEVMKPLREDQVVKDMVENSPPDRILEGQVAKAEADNCRKEQLIKIGMEQSKSQGCHHDRKDFSILF